MRFLATTLLGLCILASTLPAPASADAPPLLSHQGRLLDANGDPLSGSVALDFGLYLGLQGGNPLWTETHQVDLIDGVYSVILGSINPFGSLTFDERYYLEVTLNNESLPRHELVSVPYAIRSTIHPNQVDEEALTFDPATQTELGDVEASLLALITDLQQQVADLSTQLETAGKPFMLGLGNTVVRGGTVFNGKSGRAAGTEICKVTFPNEPGAHVCSLYEVDRALAEDSFDPAIVQTVNGVQTWTYEIAQSDGSSNCRGWGYQTGHIAHGTALTINFDDQTGGGPPAHWTQSVRNQACSNARPILCCR